MASARATSIRLGVSEASPSTAPPPSATIAATASESVVFTSLAFLEGLLLFFEFDTREAWGSAAPVTSLGTAVFDATTDAAPPATTSASATESVSFEEDDGCWGVVIFLDGSDCGMTLPPFLLAAPRWILFSA